MKKNSFSTHFLDRASAKREDTLWITSQLENYTIGIIPIWNSKILFISNRKQEPVFLNLQDFKGSFAIQESFIFLGLMDNKPYFAIEIDSQEFASHLCDKRNGEFLDLRQMAPLLTYQDCALLALARFMTNWHSRNRFCGKCGNITRNSNAGNSLTCTNNQCKHTLFPSMDPAIIVLVASGKKCLLGSQQGWPDGMYSTIAGFVEPGESIEDAVFREVEEETGILVDEVEYQSSQPWLFPSSLMLGFTAKAESKKIIIAKSELDDARWFSREEIQDNLDKGLMKLPSKVSIAYNLIKTWYDNGNVGKLDPT